MKRLIPFLFVLSFSAPAFGQTSEDITSLVTQAKHECVDANQNMDLGEASVEDWCKIKAWSVLGEKYPSKADKLVETESELNETIGQLNELRTQMDQTRAQNRDLNQTVGRLKHEKSQKVSKFTAVFISVGALLVGGASGYLLKTLQ